MTLYDRRFNL